MKRKSTAKGIQIKWLRLNIEKQIGNFSTTALELTMFENFIKFYQPQANLFHREMEVTKR